jgi:hypothetical protein
VLRNIKELTTLNDSEESPTMTDDACPGQDKGICKSNTAAALARRAACCRINMKENTHTKRLNGREVLPAPLRPWSVWVVPQEVDSDRC